MSERPRRRSGDSAPAVPPPPRPSKRNESATGTEKRYDRLIWYWTKVVATAVVSLGIIVALVFLLMSWQAPAVPWISLQVGLAGESIEAKRAWFRANPVFKQLPLIEKAVQNPGIGNEPTFLAPQTLSWSQLVRDDQTKPIRPGGPQGNVILWSLRTMGLVHQASANREAFLALNPGQAWELPLSNLPNGQRPDPGAAPWSTQGNEQWLNVEEFLKQVTRKANPDGAKGPDYLTVVFLDLCPLDSITPQTDFSSAAFIQRFQEIFTDPTKCEQWPNCAVILSHGPGQQNWQLPGQSKSLFQFALEKALVLGMADLDRQGQITFAELQNYLRASVEQDSLYLCGTSNVARPTVCLSPDLGQATNELILAQWKQPPPTWQTNDSAAMFAASAELDQAWEQLEKQFVNDLLDRPVSLVACVEYLLRMEQLWQANQTENSGEWGVLSQRVKQLLSDTPQSERQYATLTEAVAAGRYDVNRTVTEYQSLRKKNAELSQLRTELERRKNVAAQAGDQPPPPLAPNEPTTEQLAEAAQKLEKELAQSTNLLRGDTLVPYALWQHFTKAWSKADVAQALAVDLEQSLKWYDGLLVDTANVWQWNLAKQGATGIGDASHNNDWPEIRFLRWLQEQVDWGDGNRLQAAKLAIECRELSWQLQGIDAWQIERYSTDLGQRCRGLLDRQRQLEDWLIAGQNQPLADGFADLRRDLVNAIEERLQAMMRVRRQAERWFAWPLIAQTFADTTRWAAVQPFLPLNPPDIVAQFQTTAPTGNLYDQLGLSAMIGEYLNARSLGTAQSKVDADTRVVTQWLLLTPWLSSEQRRVVRTAFRTSWQEGFVKLCNDLNDPKSALAPVGDVDGKAASATDNRPEWPAQTFQAMAEQTPGDIWFGKEWTGPILTDNWERYFYAVTAGGDEATLSALQSQRFLAQPDPQRWLDATVLPWQKFRDRQRIVVTRQRVDGVLADFWGDMSPRTDGGFYFADLATKLLGNLPNNSAELDTNWSPTAVIAQHVEAARSFYRPDWSVVSDKNEYRRTAPPPFPNAGNGGALLWLNAAYPPLATSQFERGSERDRLGIAWGNSGAIELAEPFRNTQVIDPGEYREQLLFRGHVIGRPLLVEALPVPVVVNRKTLRTELTVPSNPPTWLLTHRQNPIERDSIVLLLDCSASMKDAVGQRAGEAPVGIPKIQQSQVASKVLLETLSTEYAYQVSTVAFGATKNFKVADSKIKPELNIKKNDWKPLADNQLPHNDAVILNRPVRLSKSDVTAFKDQIDKLEPFGMTPLYAALKQTIEFDDPPLGEKLFVLTDGIEYTLFNDPTPGARFEGWKLDIDYNANLRNLNNLNLNNRLKIFQFEKEDPRFFSKEVETINSFGGVPLEQRFQHLKQLAGSANYFPISNQSLTEMLLSHFEFPEVQYQVIGSADDRRAIVAREIAYEQIPENGLIQSTRDEFDLRQNRKWIGERFTVQTNDVQFSNNALTSQVLPGDAVGVVLDEGERRLHFVGPAVDHPLRKLARGPETGLDLWLPTVKETKPYRVRIFEDQSNYRGPGFEIWAEDPRDQRFTFRPWRAVLEVQADKVVPGMPSSYLIQDYLVFSDNNVVTLKFLPFDTKNVPAGMNPPVQMGDLAQPWRFRLYLWSQEQPPISINKEIDVDYETAGELMLQIEEPKMQLDIKWAFPDDRVIVTVIASENPQVDRVVIDPMDKDGNWISGGKVTRQAEYDDARPQRVVHTWELSKEDWQRLRSFRIVPVYGTYVDLEKNSLEFKRDNLMR